jgi:hypothetical protein
MMLRRLFVLTLSIGLLAGCGSGTGIVRRINPPAASIQRLAVDASGAIAIELRVQNYSTVPMKFLRIDASVRIAGIDAGRIALTPGIEIPGQSGDVVPATLSPDSGTAPALRAQLQANTGIAYALNGSIATEDPDKTFPFTFDSRLSPVPGRPGEFR